jgi:hypothetical protein
MDLWWPVVPVAAMVNSFDVVVLGEVPLDHPWIAAVTPRRDEDVEDLGDRHPGSDQQLVRGKNPPAQWSGGV